MKLLLSLLLVASVASFCVGWSVDFRFKQNSVVHRTNKFKDSSNVLIVRRGQDVINTLNVENGLGLKYKLVKVNQLADSEELVTLSDKEMSSMVHVLERQVGSMERTVTLRFLPGAEVGKWSWTIEVYNKTVKVGSKSTKIYVLFNPWERSEPVYLASEREINEYVVADSAVMYFGSPNARGWTFGQYEEGVLDIVFKVIARATNKPKNNTVTITRAVSAIANNHTKGGIVEGRWTRDFSGGTNPLDWSSSVQVLKQYNQTNRPVKYGQCWVFAGVVGTILRAIGIPTRTVTTDFSGVDVNRDILLDKCLDENGNVYVDGKFCGVDRRWNYHIWNEVWMKRSDIRSPVYSHYAWQVVDGTPAVVNDGQYKIGPAPVSAVKWGDSNVTYETDFVYAEVMAPVVAWLVDPKTGQRKKVLSVDYTKTGERIVGKSIGSNVQVDRYTDYKFTNKHFKRASLVRALQNHGTDPRIIDYDPVKKASVLFDLQVNSTVKLGQDLVVKLKLTSLTRTKEKVHIKLVTESVDQLEDTWKHINTSDVDVTLGPGQKQELIWKIPVKMYANKLYPGNGVAFNIIAYVEGKDQIWGKRDVLTITNPNLQVRNVEVNQLTGNTVADVNFHNPLPITLTNCYISLSGISNIETTKIGTIVPYGQLQIKDVSVKDKSLIETVLNCDEISGIASSPV